MFGGDDFIFQTHQLLNVYIESPAQLPADSPRLYICMADLEGIFLPTKSMIYTNMVLELHQYIYIVYGKK